MSAKDSISPCTERPHISRGRDRGDPSGYWSPVGCQPLEGLERLEYDKRLRVNGLPRPTVRNATAE